MASKNATQSAPESQDSGAFVPQVQTGTVNTDSRFPLDPSEPYLLFCSEDAFQVVGGRLLPAIADVRMRPGVLNVDRWGGVQGLVGLMTLQRRILIPPDRDVPAWGSRVRGYNRQVEIRTTDARGNKMFAYCTIWEKPRLLGSRVIWDRDAEGWVQFLEEVHKDLLGGRIDPAVKQITEAPLREEYAALRRRPAHDVAAQDRLELLYSVYPSLRQKAD